MADPQINVTQFTPLCSVGWRPLLITGFLLEWMRNHFSATNAIEDSELSNTLWKAENTTNILIESITRWKPELTGKRPAIIVKRNAINNVRLGIDDRIMGDRPTVALGERYATYFQGSHTLFCLSTEGGEVEKLSTEVYRELVEFGPLMREALQLHKLHLQTIDTIFKLEEHKEVFVVPVVLGYAFEDAWQIVPRAPTIKKIDLAIFQP